MQKSQFLLLVLCVLLVSKSEYCSFTQCGEPEDRWTPISRCERDCIVTRITEVRNNIGSQTARASNMMFAVWDDGMEQVLARYNQCNDKGQPVHPFELPAAWGYTSLMSPFRHNPMNDWGALYYTDVYSVDSVGRAMCSGSAESWCSEFNQLITWNVTQFACTSTDCKGSKRVNYLCAFNARSNYDADGMAPFAVGPPGTQCPAGTVKAGNFCKKAYTMGAYMVLDTPFDSNMKETYEDECRATLSKIWSRTALSTDCSATISEEGKIFIEGVISFETMDQLVAGEARLIIEMEALKRGSAPDALFAHIDASSVSTVEPQRTRAPDDLNAARVIFASLCGWLLLPVLVSVCLPLV